MRLDVALVDSRRTELPLQYDVGFPETLLDVAQPVLYMTGDVAVDPGILATGHPIHPEVGC